MALAATCQWEVRTGGSDDNGGAFNSAAAGTDYTLQNAAQKTGTDLTMHPTINTRVQPVGAGVAAADVGNVIQVRAGTGWTVGWYEITAQDGTYWTLDRSPAAAGSANLGTYNMGGALASPGKLGEALANSNSRASGMNCWIKSGTYTITSTTANVTGGRVSLPSSIMLRVEGYDNTRGDLGTKPVISAGTQTSFTIFTTNGDFNNKQQFVVNLEFNGNSQTSVRGISCVVNGYRDRIWRCRSKNCNNVGFFGQAEFIECIAESCNIGLQPSSHSSLYGCVAFSSTSDGFLLGSTQGQSVVNCLSYSNGGKGFNTTTGFPHTFINCVAHGNTGDGFDFQTYGMQVAINCLATNNGGWGFNLSNRDTFLINCAGRSNTTGNVDTTTVPFVNQGFVTLTADPYQNAAGADFRLNNNAGGGAALRGLGIGVTGQTDSQDIGAVQTAAGSSGGGGLILPRPMNGGYSA
jgi:hypothetical protein